MTEVGRFFDAVLYSEADQAEVQNRFRSPGVIAGAGSTLLVGAGGSMVARVLSGEAFVQGFWYKNTATLDLPVANNTSGSTRIDVVVLRLDRIGNTLVLAVLQGTPGAGTPALTQNAVVWEMSLATLTIPTGTTSAITAGMITDIRTYSRTVQFGAEMADAVVGSNHIVDGAVSNLLLNYKAATDLFSASSIPATTYTNLVGAQSFTVSAGCTAILIAAQISAVDISTGSIQTATHIFVDGTTRYQLAPSHRSTNAMAASGGILIIPGLSAGIHTITPQIYTTLAFSGTFYLRAGTQAPTEFLAMQVVEFRA
jgi:hypothetical protein